MTTAPSTRKDPDALRRHLLAAGLIALFFVFSYSLFGIQYRTNDDATLANIAAGAYGDSLHMVYVNFLFSALLRPLYALAPACNWYVFSQVFLMYCACVLLADLALEKLGTLRGVLLTCIGMLTYSYVMLYRFQYVHTSGFFVASGLVLIAFTLGHPTGRTVAGILLALAGSMLRWPNFLAMGGMSAAMLLGFFFRLNREEQKKAVCTMLVLFALVFGAKGADHLFYQMDPGWQAFTVYNDARTDFSDYAVFHIPGEAADFVAEGIFTPLESQMLVRWDFFDPAVYTPDALHAAADSIPMRPLHTALRETLRTLLELVHGAFYRYFFTGLLVYVLFFVRWNKKLLPLLCTMGIFTGMVLLLRYLNRFPSYVEVPMLLGLILYGIACLALADHRLPDTRWVLGAFLALLLLRYPGVVQGQILESRAYRERIPLEEPYMQAMHADTDHLYLLSTEAITVTSGLDPLHPRPVGFHDNIVHYGGWLSAAPTGIEAMARYGVTRPLVDAVDNDAVYLGYHGIEYAAAYASEQLGCPVEAVDCGPNPFAPYQLRRVTTPQP